MSLDDGRFLMESGRYEVLKASMDGEILRTAVGETAIRQHHITRRQLINEYQ